MSASGLGRLTYPVKAHWLCCPSHRWLCCPSQRWISLAEPGVDHLGRAGTEGGLLSYRHEDGRWTHTLGDGDGFGRKLAQLGIEGD